MNFIFLTFTSHNNKLKFLTFLMFFFLFIAFDFERVLNIVFVIIFKKICVLFPFFLVDFFFTSKSAILSFMSIDDGVDGAIDSSERVVGVVVVVVVVGVDCDVRVRFRASESTVATPKFPFRRFRINFDGCGGGGREGGGRGTLTNHWNTEGNFVLVVAVLFLFRF